METISGLNKNLHIYEKNDPINSFGKLENKDRGEFEFTPV